jgi:hypothetical protein
MSGEDRAAIELFIAGVRAWEIDGRLPGKGKIVPGALVRTIHPASASSSPATARCGPGLRNRSLLVENCCLFTLLARWTKGGLAMVRVLTYGANMFNSQLLSLLEGATGIRRSLAPPKPSANPTRSQYGRAKSFSCQRMCCPERSRSTMPWLTLWTMSRNKSNAIACDWRLECPRPCQKVRKRARHVGLLAVSGAPPMNRRRWPGCARDHSLHPAPTDRYWLFEKLQRPGR